MVSQKPPAEAGGMPRREHEQRPAGPDVCGHCKAAIRWQPALRAKSETASLKTETNNIS